MEQPGTASSAGMDEVRSGRPWWQMCFGGCLLFIFALIIGGFMLMQGIAGGGVRQLQALPSNYPSLIEPFHLNEVAHIEYLQGKDKAKMMNLLYAPLRLLSRAESSAGGISASSESLKEQEAVGNDVRSIDTVTLTWKNLHATSAEVASYYIGQFKTAGLTLTESRDEAAKSIDVIGIRQGIFAQVSIQGSSSTQAVDEVVLVVSYSNK